MSDAALAEHGEEEVQDNSPREACEAVYCHEYYCGHDDDVADEVFVEVEVLELERLHIEAADHCSAHECNERQ